MAETKCVMGIKKHPRAPAWYGHEGWRCGSVSLHELAARIPNISQRPPQFASGWSLTIIILIIRPSYPVPGTSRGISGAAGPPRYPEVRFLLGVKLRSCVGWFYAWTDYLYLPQRGVTRANHEVRSQSVKHFP